VRLKLEIFCGSANVEIVGSRLLAAFGEAKAHRRLIELASISRSAIRGSAIIIAHGKPQNEAKADTSRGTIAWSR